MLRLKVKSSAYFKHRKKKFERHTHTHTHTKPLLEIVLIKLWVVLG